MCDWASCSERMQWTCQWEHSTVNDRRRQLQCVHLIVLGLQPSIRTQRQSNSLTWIEKGVAAVGLLLSQFGVAVQLSEAHEWRSLPGATADSQKLVEQCSQSPALTDAVLIYELLMWRHTCVKVHSAVLVCIRSFQNASFISWQRSTLHIGGQGSPQASEQM